MIFATYWAKRQFPLSKPHQSLVKCDTVSVTPLMWVMLLWWGWGELVSLKGGHWLLTPASLAVQCWLTNKTWPQLLCTAWPAYTDTVRVPAECIVRAHKGQGLFPGYTHTHTVAHTHTHSHTHTHTLWCTHTHTLWRTHKHTHTHTHTQVLSAMDFWR